MTAQAPNYDELFRSMIDNLREQLQPKAVILFGSRARGNAMKESDYDIVVIAEYKVEYFARVAQVLRLKPPLPLDVFYYTPSEFEEIF